MKKELKKYQFYYKFNVNGEKNIVEVKECKKPEQTKVYKTLEDNFNNGFIEAYGYQQIK